MRKVRSINSPLARLPSCQGKVDHGSRRGLASAIVEPAGPPLGPVVVIVTVTGTDAPFRLTVEGLKLIVMPAGSCVVGTTSVTVLGLADRGATLIVAVWDGPAVTVFLVGCGKLMPGMFTLI